jgi:glycosyltransferase involved in cell wall biosynthesis
MPEHRPPSPQRARICFVVTEDWFFVSHFLPFAQAALADGFAVSLICNVGKHGAMLEASGIRVLPFAARRRSLNPLRLIGAIRRLRQLLAAERPDIVHLVALKPIVLGGLAARLAGIGNRVVALTGTGFLGLAQGPAAGLVRLALRHGIRPVLAGPGTRWLFENHDDIALFGLSAAAGDRITVVGGAGIDETAITPQPLPAGNTLKVALVARMLWSKGIDTAVEAVRVARERGADVTLSLYGLPDAANPRAFTETELTRWAAREAIAWHGHAADIPSIWAAHHLCLLPSRGGEGLPRSLLEAAASGRAILTTDVPGCRDLVRDGIEGRIVPPGDAEALAQALCDLAHDRTLVARMGQAARARRADGFTQKAVSAAVLALYRDLAGHRVKPL